MQKDERACPYATHDPCQCEPRPRLPIDEMVPALNPLANSLTSNIGGTPSHTGLPVLLVSRSGLQVRKPQVSSRLRAAEPQSMLPTQHGQPPRSARIAAAVGLALLKTTA